MGLDAWKRLLQLLCDCYNDLPRRAELLNEFVVLFYFQLKTIEPDFFEDLFTGDNFLKTVMPMLFAHVQDADGAPAALKKRAAQLRAFCENKFKRSFDYPDQ